MALRPSTVSGLVIGAIVAPVAALKAVDLVVRRANARALRDGSFWTRRLGDRAELRLGAERRHAVVLVHWAMAHGYAVRNIERRGDDLVFTVARP